MDDYFILAATLKTVGPEVELSLYVVYADGSDRVITLSEKDLPSLIRTVRTFDLNRESEAAHG